MIQELRGLLYLVGLTMKRQFFARKSIIAALLIALLGTGVAAWSIRRVPRMRDADKRGEVVEINRDGVREGRRGPLDGPVPKITRRPPEERILHEFGQDIVIDIFVSVFIPLLCLIYGTSALGDERDDRTMVYLLTRPLSRWRVYLAKGLGVLPIALLVVLGTFALICLVAGEPGQKLFMRFMPGIALGTVAYTSLFLLFGAIAPRPLIMSVFYAFLIETLVGNMPGTLKRIALSYHIKCILYGAGENIGLGADNLSHFVPITSATARTVLWTAAGLLAIYGAVAFQRREYRDLA